MEKTVLIFLTFAFLSHLLECKNNPNSCKFTINNENTFYDSYLFNSSRTDPSKTTIKFPLASNHGCQATFVSIGFGGSFGYHFGGGSGYVEYVVIDISSTEYEVEYSSVKNKEGDTIIHANGGGVGDGMTGGRGYSGGGDTSSSGGSNGSDGYGENGGKGSGTNISEIPLDNFVLSPGDGGVNNVYNGGGGGGILVDNIGPDSFEYQGKGFGGGGGGGDFGDFAYGLPGTVLIEVKSK
jgi:hypothetical protein